MPPDPVDAIIKSGNLETTLGRAKIRDNLYALLATAPDAKTAKKIAGRLEGIWRRSGSPTVDVLMSRAAKALKEKKFPRALKFLDAAVDLAPDYAGGFNRRAYAHYLAGDLRSAVGDLRRTLALDPNHFRALDGLATILRETGQDAAALKTFDRLLEVHPFADGAQKAFDNLTDDVKGRGI
ncbi:MAG: tetratricopeptide repeat protein [Pseudomonadota bacterium]